MHPCVAVLFALVAVSVSALEKYPSRFDSIDLEAVLRDDKRVDGAIKCLLDEGPCSKDAEFLKLALPDALRTQCARCTERQRAGAERTVRFLMEHRASDWARLERKFDPQGTFRRRYEEARKKQG